MRVRRSQSTTVRADLALAWGLSSRGCRRRRRPTGPATMPCWVCGACWHQGTATPPSMCAHPGERRGGRRTFPAAVTRWFAPARATQADGLRALHCLQPGS